LVVVVLVMVDGFGIDGEKALEHFLELRTVETHPFRVHGRVRDATARLR
jgi:hypothetical protein